MHQEWEEITESRNWGKIPKEILSWTSCHMLTWALLKVFPRQGAQLFTFPRKLIPLDTNDGLFLLILSQNYFPITWLTGHASSVLIDMPGPSLTDLHLLDMKTISMSPYSCSREATLFYISNTLSCSSYLLKTLHSPPREIQFAHISTEKWHLELKVILYKLSTFIH